MSYRFQQKNWLQMQQMKEEEEREKLQRKAQLDLAVKEEEYQSLKQQYQKQQTPTLLFPTAYHLQKTVQKPIKEEIKEITSEYIPPELMSNNGYSMNPTYMSDSGIHGGVNGVGTIENNMANLEMSIQSEDLGDDDQSEVYEDFFSDQFKEEVLNSEFLEFSQDGDASSYDQQVQPMDQSQPIHPAQQIQQIQQIQQVQQMQQQQQSTPQKQKLKPKSQPEPWILPNSNNQTPTFSPQPANKFSNFTPSHFQFHPGSPNLAQTPSQFEMDIKPQPQEFDFFISFFLFHFFFFFLSFSFFSENNPN